MAKFLIDSLSVFFPTYNEEANIKKTVLAAKEVLEQIANKWEMIIVNDGSKDATAAVIKKLEDSDARIRVITHNFNKGYGAVLKTGFRSSKYPWVAFMDSDGQFDFGEIKKFIAKKDTADLILGYRIKRADSLARKFFTYGWSTLAKILLGLNAKDYSCGFKLIKKNVFNSILPLVGEEKVTQIEMLIKAKRKGFIFAEVGVHHYPRQFGQPTGAKLRVVARSIIDLFTLWRKLR